MIHDIMAITLVVTSALVKGAWVLAIYIRLHTNLIQANSTQFINCEHWWHHTIRVNNPFLQNCFWHETVAPSRAWMSARLCARCKKDSSVLHTGGQVSARELTEMRQTLHRCTVSIGIFYIIPDTHPHFSVQQQRTA